MDTLLVLQLNFHWHCDGITVGIASWWATPLKGREYCHWQWQGKALRQAALAAVVSYTDRSLGAIPL